MVVDLIARIQYGKCIRNEKYPGGMPNDILELIESMSKVDFKITEINEVHGLFADDGVGSPEVKLQGTYSGQEALGHLKNYLEGEVNGRIPFEKMPFGVVHRQKKGLNYVNLRTCVDIPVGPGISNMYFIDFKQV
jgi:hypothetical protein